MQIFGRPDNGLPYLYAGEVGHGYFNQYKSPSLFLLSENANVFGKGSFPYSEAAFYSSQLWHSQTGGKVVKKWGQGSSKQVGQDQTTQLPGGGDLNNCEFAEEESGL